MMIHRGTVGSMERVTAALLERYQGRLPLWLAPVQVCVLPVGPEHDAAARRLADDLLAAGLRPRLETAGSRRRPGPRAAASAATTSSPSSATPSWPTAACRSPTSPAASAARSRPPT